MKCRILKKNGQYVAQYQKSGKWKTLKNHVFDQRDGGYETECFETASGAERALRSFAETKEPTVVKEFEI